MKKQTGNMLRSIRTEIWKANAVRQLLSGRLTRRSLLSILTGSALTVLGIGYLANAELTELAIQSEETSRVANESLGRKLSVLDRALDVRSDQILNSRLIKQELEVPYLALKEKVDELHNQIENLHQQIKNEEAIATEQENVSAEQENSQFLANAAWYNLENGLYSVCERRDGKGFRGIESDRFEGSGVVYGMPYWDYSLRVGYDHVLETWRVIRRENDWLIQSQAGESSVWADIYNCPIEFRSNREYTGR